MGLKNLIKILIFFILPKSYAQSDSLQSNSSKLDTSRFIIDKIPNPVFLNCDVRPQFPGGTMAMYNFISENLIYPNAAIENKKEGKIILKFIIDSLGEICCIGIIGDSIGYGLETEAARILKAMPPWTPAYLDDKPVAVYYRMPIIFKYYEE